MTLVQTKDPSEFWMCLRLPKNERRHKHFVGKERTREYETRGPVFKDEKQGRITSIPPSPKAKPIIKPAPLVTYPKSGVGPAFLIRQIGEQPLAWIKRWVAFKHGVSVAELEGKCKIQKFVDARQEYFFYGRTIAKRSFPKIAKHCGGRDHTTALHGARKFADKHGFCWSVLACDQYPT